MGQQHLEVLPDRGYRHDARRRHQNAKRSGWQTRATALVNVAEKNPSDFLVGQGLLVGTVEYFSKSHVLNQEYDDEAHPFGWMQDGVFELFEQEERLHRWTTEEDLVDAAEELP
ncbi:hypothetical protein GCM10009021_24730 [Halarchaeum nitratireducens]|uniref:Uncharacterized protein n=1 Tax=Halarchaeum nitratireducens TaxID=489913 RepID=A0A830GE20_9EURY|nr:hypothetical protein GCM10009021_24730 [Halarchaeum nitratireducens]